MDKIPKIEINCIPSQLNTSAPTGVASQLAQVAQNEPRFDNVTIEQMRGNPIYQRGDKIDTVGQGQKTIVDNANIIKSRSSKIRALNEAAQRVQKPSQRPRAV